jgi:hypothetical protein
MSKLKEHGLCRRLLKREKAGSSAAPRNDNQKSKGNDNSKSSNDTGSGTDQRQNKYFATLPNDI